MMDKVNSVKSVLRDDSGSVLVVVLLMVFATAIMGFAMASMSSVDVKISGNQQAHTNALYAAEAGLAEARHGVAPAEGIDGLVLRRGIDVEVAHHQDAHAGALVEACYVRPRLAPTLGHDRRAVTGQTAII